jgi:hypothetical protein
MGQSNVVALGRHIGLRLRDSAFLSQNVIKENRHLSSNQDSKEICVFSGLSPIPIRPAPVPNCCWTYRDIGLFTKVVGMYRRKRFWAHCHLWCTYMSAEKAYGKDIIVVLPQSR